MTARFFGTPQAGEEREKMLAAFRATLRKFIGQIDPATGQPITEDDIVRATQEGSRWYGQFNAVDLALLAIHAKAAGLADQVVPSRSTSGMLRGLHAPMRGVEPLPAAGGSMRCTAVADPGALFVGSTTIPDPAAAFAVDASGLRYQVLYSVTTPANGVAGSDDAQPLILAGVDTGERTNLDAGTTLTWAGNAPLSAAKTFTTSEDGRGGIADETDGDLARRIEDDIAHPPASGNNAHVRKWARESTASVEDAFVYACAKYAGTMVVCVTQKRGQQSEASPKGPLARIPSAVTLTRARAYLVPPASPKVPERVTSFVVAPVAQYTNLVLGLSLPRGRGLGWADVRPWPAYSSGPVTVTSLSDATHFTVTSSGANALPSGSVLPQIMVWARERSRWEALRVASITPGGGNTFAIVLASAPTHAIAVGDRISPLVRGFALLGQAVERYFDALGPGEVVNLSTDPRAPRARRFPDPVERYPQKAGPAIISTLQTVLPGTITSGELLSISATTPTIPADPSSGPSMLVAGHLAVYPAD